MSAERADGGNADMMRLLAEARRAEKQQAMLYRSLGAAAEATSPDLAQRFHDLHADEQHHLSRLTARLLELGGSPEDLIGVTISPPDLSSWPELVRNGEQGEIERYQALLEGHLDDATLNLLREILEVERHHAEELGGKWMMA